MLTSAAECEIGVAAGGGAFERRAIADVAVDERAGKPASRSRSARRRRARCPRAASARTTARPRYPVPPVTSTFMTFGCASTRAGRRASARAESRAVQPSSSRSRLGSPSRSGVSFGPVARRIHLHGDRDARAREQQIEQLADRDRASGADVVGPAGRAAFEDQRVGAHRVAHVGEIAPRLEVADRDLRLPSVPRSMSAIRRAKPDAAKCGSCRGPKWLNGARDRHAERRRSICTAEHLLRELAQPVRARRHERMRPR